MIYVIGILILCVGGYFVADTIYAMGVRAGRELSAIDRAHIKKQAYDEGRHAQQARQGSSASSRMRAFLAGYTAAGHARQ